MVRTFGQIRTFGQTGQTLQQVIDANCGASLSEISSLNQQIATIQAQIDGIRVQIDGLKNLEASLMEAEAGGIPTTTIPTETMPISTGEAATEAVTPSLTAGLPSWALIPLVGMGLFMLLGGKGKKRK